MSDPHDRNASRPSIARAYWHELASVAIALWIWFDPTPPSPLRQVTFAIAAGFALVLIVRRLVGRAPRDSTRTSIAIRLFALVILLIGVVVATSRHG